MALRSHRDSRWDLPVPLPASVPQARDSARGPCHVSPLGIFSSALPRLSRRELTGAEVRELWLAVTSAAHPAFLATLCFNQTRSARRDRSPADSPPALRLKSGSRGPWALLTAAGSASRRINRGCPFPHKTNKTPLNVQTTSLYPPSNPASRCTARAPRLVLFDSYRVFKFSLKTAFPVFSQKGRARCPPQPSPSTKGLPGHERSARRG